jgi:pimeloyl-ACP methyl ester carboxylesterase
MKRLLTAITGIIMVLNINAEDTVPALKDAKAPETVDALWKDYDPRKEPLDVEIIKEWEEDGVVVKVLRYRVGVFKGKEAMMAAVYGYPKGAKNLPGLVQIHGGGQYADANAILANAKEGYATISISWAGRISSSKYRVTNVEKKLFWNSKKKDKNYRVTTDWGAVDAYHAPCRFRGSNFITNPPSRNTIDSIESPRNSGWFLATMGARRAVTFLEQQPQVDKDKIGVYGHSMGGKLTVLTAGSDKRIKAAAPSCGGISNLTGRRGTHSALADDSYLKKITCPIIFLSPSNDFHGLIDDLQQAVKDIKSKHWRVVCSPHMSHRDRDDFVVDTMLWFNQYLKGSFKFPETPKTSLKLKTADGNPLFSVSPDKSKKILSLDIYYTQQTVCDSRNKRNNNINKFWHHAEAKEKNGTWTAKLPLLTTDKPLWVYANVRYKLNKKVNGAGYYYGIYSADKFNLSSLTSIVSAKELKAAGVKANMQPTVVIEDFQGDWKKEWFKYSDAETTLRTHKIYNDKYKAPAPNSKLSISVLSEKANKIALQLDDYAAEIELKGSPDWQTFVLDKSDFLTADKKPLRSWKKLFMLAVISSKQHLIVRPPRGSKKKVIRRIIGGEWKGKKVQLKDLKWLKKYKD